MDRESYPVYPDKKNRNHSRYFRLRAFNTGIVYKMLEGLKKKLEEEDTVTQRLMITRNC